MKRALQNRRDFLRAVGALSAFGLAARLDWINPVTDANAQGAADYKALVCVFMFGGNDGNNTVIPLDTAGYGRYAAVRPVESNLNLAQASLLPIQPVNLGTPFGLHPALTELQSLFNKRKVAILANVGTLPQPTTQAQYNAGLQPDSLYSHADQQAQWQSASYREASNTGWGGRVADQVAAYNAATQFPVITSLDGAVLFTTGKSTVPLSIPEAGSFALSGYAATDAATTARLNALTQLLAQSSSNTFVNSANAIGTQALQLSGTVNPIINNANSLAAPLFAKLTSDIAKQLFQVAKVIEGRAMTGASRQIFFVQLGSFDTHNDQLNRQQKLFSDLSPALGAFYDATVALGVASQVTTFTMSDFSRTFQAAAGGGTDHAWGNHHFIMGDAVQGGSFYGQYPALVLGGPNDAVQEGRWIPTTSLDQYGATLAKWFGVSTQNLGAVFPNLANFAVSDLGFLG